MARLARSNSFRQSGLAHILLSRLSTRLANWSCHAIDDVRFSRYKGDFPRSQLIFEDSRGQLTSITMRSCSIHFLFYTQQSGIVQDEDHSSALVNLRNHGARVRSYDFRNKHFEVTIVAHDKETLWHLSTFLKYLPASRPVLQAQQLSPSLGMRHGTQDLHRSRVTTSWFATPRVQQRTIRLTAITPRHK